MTRYGHDIEVLKQAAELCREGGCESAIPYIMRRIHWMQENDYEKLQTIKTMKQEEIEKGFYSRLEDLDRYLTENFKILSRRAMTQRQYAYLRMVIDGIIMIKLKTLKQCTTRK